MTVFKRAGDVTLAFGDVEQFSPESGVRLDSMSVVVLVRTHLAKHSSYSIP